MNYLYLLPLGNIDNKLLEYLGKNIQKAYNVPFQVLDSIKVPLNAKDAKRNQYQADIILNELNLLSFQNIWKLVGVTDVDIYSEDLSYIFGLAEAPGRNSVISLARLDQEFYGEKYNKDMLYDRAVKEALHELGHNLNMSHCPDRNCAMYFSNIIEDTDFKNTSYCERCAKLIEVYNK